MSKNSVFIKSREDTVTVSAKVPRSLKLRADKLREQIQDIDDELSFDLSVLIRDAIEEAVEKGEKELTRLKKATQQERGTTSGSPKTTPSTEVL